MIFGKKLFCSYAFASLLVFFAVFPSSVFASTTDGTIDSTNKYAEGLNPNVGKINFGLTAGNVHVTDTLLTGYAWSETSGWINLSPTNGGITNNAEGVLSGYAWGQNSGWINFAPTQGGVTIDTLGAFHGYAWSQNLGWISFNCANNSTCGTDNYSVQTDWRPLSTRTPAPTPTPTPSTSSTGGGSGVSVAGVPVINTPSVQTIAATSIATTTAALNGYLNPNGTADTVRWFEWGTSPLNLSNQTTHYNHGAVADGFSDTISGLVSDTPYYFRAVAQNSYGTVAGYVLSFTIPSTSPSVLNPVVAPTTLPTTPAIVPTPTPFIPPTPGTITVPPGPAASGGVAVGGGAGTVSGGGGGSSSGIGGGVGAAPSILILPPVVTATVQQLVSTSRVLTAQAITNAKKRIVEFSATPVGSITTKTVTTAGVVGGGAVAVATVAGNVASLSDFPLIVVRLWSLLLVALGFRKRRVPWGTVYDSVTKQPLDPAYVVLSDPSEKEAGTAITDLDGRFGFLVQPGSYHIVANKTNYSFPSKKLLGKSNDELYDNLYFGGDVELGANEVVAKNIPMDPEAFDWNEFAKRDKKLMMFYSRNTRIFNTVSTILFYVGLVSAVGLFLARPDSFNVAIIVLYGVLLILRIFGLKPKAYGTIIDAGAKEPLSFAIVRIFQKDSDREMFHRVTDQYGRYYSLLARGEYYLTIERKNIDETYTLVFTSDTINAKKGIINKNFRI